jgi:hypothetical protein
MQRVHYEDMSSLKQDKLRIVNSSINIMET